MQARSQTNVVNGLKLHHLEWGLPEALPIVLLHGLRSYGATWEPIAEKLANRWRLIALDQRGRGDSDWDANADYFTEAYVSDLEQWADQLGLQRFVLVGHSMGGTNAFVYTHRHPERVSALVIEDIGPGASAGGEGAERIRRELQNTPKRFDSWDAARAFWRAQRPLASQEAIESRARHAMRESGDGAIVWKYDAEGIARARLDTTQRFVDLWPCVRELQCPTLLLRGERSDFLTAPTAQAMVEANPVLQLKVVPGASHYAHDDNFPAFMAALEGFLDALPEGARP